MSQNQAPESSKGPDLPRFADRLPDLVHVIRQAGHSLAKASPKQSYLPYWEDLYFAVHSLKGVLQILECPKDLGELIVTLNGLLLEGLTGTKICRKIPESGNAFITLADLFDQKDPNTIEKNKIKKWLNDFSSLYEEDIDHPKRITEIPAHLFYVNEFVSKKAREVTLLQLNHCTVEDEILLEEIPIWRTHLLESLLHEDFGRGIVINFLPFLSSEGSRKIKVWAWVAAASHTRAGLKQRIKEVMPKALLGKI